MRELDPIRRLAPPVEPLGPDAVERIRARALAPRRRRVPVAGLLVPAAAVAVVAVVVVLGGSPDREVPAQAPAAAAEGTPRLLLDGWSVTRVDEWKVDNGEMTFARDGRELVLTWMPADLAGDIGSKPGVRRELDFGTSAGARATVWRMEQAAEYIAVWRKGEITVTARGVAESAAAFAGLVEHVRQAGADEWRRALPERAVTPDDQRAAVEKMVGEIPLPPGVDSARLGAGVTTRDRYQLAATVAGTIACGWIRAWIDGDEPTRARAEAVLATSRDWPLLRSINAEGDYPEVLWQYADAVAGDGIVPGGKPITVEESYRSALCP